MQSHFPSLVGSNTHAPHYHHVILNLYQKYMHRVSARARDLALHHRRSTKAKIINTAWWLQMPPNLICWQIQVSPYAADPDTSRRIYDWRWFDVQSRSGLPHPTALANIDLLQNCRTRICSTHHWSHSSKMRSDLNCPTFSNWPLSLRPVPVVTKVVGPDITALFHVKVVELYV